MLAYSEWQKMSAGDLTIYNAFHPQNSIYQPEVVDFDLNLVDIVTSGAERWMAERKAFGQRKAKVRASSAGNASTERKPS